MLGFGYDTWARQGEFLLRVLPNGVALCCPRQPTAGQPASDNDLPSRGEALAEQPLPLSGVLFLLLALASVSFDGFSKTFSWLGANGINPLNFRDAQRSRPSIPSGSH